MSDHSDHSVITHHDPGEGFDHGEPNVKSIWAFTIVSIVVLVLMIIAVWPGGGDPPPPAEP